MSKDEAKPDWAMSKRERENAARVAAGQPPKKRRRWIFWLIVLVVLVAGAGWFVQSGQFAEMQAQRAAAEAEAQAEADARAARAAIIQLAPFEVTAVAPSTLVETLKITGSLAPARQVHISSEVTARVESVAVREGERVELGDVLVRFDTEALDIALTQARANAEATRVQLEKARTDFERTQDLVERGLSASNTLTAVRSALDQLTATLAAQDTLVASAQRSRDNALVRAPFSGVVSVRAVDPGEFAATGSALVTLVDLTSLEVEANAPVAYAPDLAPGLDVDLTVEGFGDRVFRGKVERVSPVALEGSRMLPVYVALENETGELRGGMFASGRIVLEARADGIGVPAGALRHDAEGAHVIVVAGDKVERRAVEVGRSWDAGAVIEIASGLEPGDMVVTEPLPELQPGDTVELVEIGQ
ncbi:efflux RND transporter periplasmic adaptor subunit [Sinisalibacter aestuarii]|uniref:RND transporter n=1 Tax=Sinisalibacter aestuarii TaxID=2949426 RepID=A0ABQ5LUF7_9RHOB|nr:efflux RND transporter periplasmic adaptor subunit [Sinisalibacter aestuarii]GKY88060.1 RND transporter [Sinisalibacter aestuarii]